MYDYNGIYFFDASYRRDASSIFHRDHRWGNFYSLGFSYLISRESFFNVPWIDDLRFKISAGQNGNDQIGMSRLMYEDSFNIDNVDGSIALSFHARGNRYITWETRTAMNTGVEFQMFRRRLTGNVDYYINRTSDMLSSVSVPFHLGYSSFWANVGSMRNSGVEFDLRYDVVRRADLRVAVYFNASMNRSKILELAEERRGENLLNFDGSVAARGYSSGNYFIGEGLEFRTWRLRRFAGVDEMGRSTWYVRDAITGEMSTTTEFGVATHFASGSSQPRMLGGFGTNVEWRSWQLNMAFVYRLGGYGIDNGYRSLMEPPRAGRTGFNYHRDTRHFWTAENPRNDFPRWQFNDLNVTAASDRWLTRSDYLSLQNISLGWSVPRSFTERVGIEGATISAGVDNLFILTHRRGFIPFNNFDGSIELGYYPEMTRYMLNFNLRF